MPPSARQRQIDSGRYEGLSEKEWKLVLAATKIPPEGN
jgi:hypothetical protein